MAEAYTIKDIKSLLMAFQSGDGGRIAVEDTVDTKKHKKHRKHRFKKTCPVCGQEKKGLTLHIRMKHGIERLIEIAGPGGAGAEKQITGTA